MVFWGETVGNEKQTVQIADGGSMYLLQVCLESIPKTNTEFTSLYIQPNGCAKGFLICHLHSQQTQFSLCHELVDEDSPLIMWTTGGKIHVTGTVQVEEGSDDDQSHSHSDAEEFECTHENEDECCATKSTNTAEKNEKKRPQSAMETKPIESVKKQKSSSTAPSGAVVAADVVIPQTHQQRKKWKIKPQNDEGVLVGEPKLLKKSSGVAITDYIIGKGAEPKLGAKVKITYEGSFPDGTVFDQRITRSKPFSFRMGTAQVIRGLDLGLEGMRIGGSREILIPPELG